MDFLDKAAAFALVGVGCAAFALTAVIVYFSFFHQGV